MRSNKIVAEQLTKDHNASIEEVRKELMSLHPGDSPAAVANIRGHVSRSIGDAYLKKPEFASTQPGDRFIIFASDGLWELLSNQKAVEIVHNNPREGIARRLIVSALDEAARRRKMKL
ncbi:hypothetical protein HAX54_031943 [Datura stramonium]|uniref:PPM-type phosphatase domain-containing protein n=1 Tax=Datura stramonium TaxID=4076 RepID=A0ABS8SCG0_DATST|nr:hypothetical protein [Datura stramonium]